MKRDIPPEAIALPLATDLDALAVSVEWDKGRTVWLLVGAPHPATVKEAARRITPCSRLVVADPCLGAHDSPALAAREARRTLGGLERVHVVEPAVAADLAASVAALIDINHYDGWKPIIGKAQMESDPLAVAELLRGVRTEMNTRVLMKSTILKMTGLFLRNALLNAPWASSPRPMAPHAQALLNRPALIVSAGPSLNKQLPLLAQHQDLFTIIAVDTVWPILNQHGIVPDYLCALDPVTPASWPANGLNERTRFVTDVMASPAMIWSHDRGHLMCSSHTPIMGLMNFLQAHVEPINVGGSVATLAFNLAVELGANPLVFIGQDLALTGGRDHADGYLYAYGQETLSDRAESGYDVEGYYGGRVRTERQLLSYKHWFEHRIAGLSDRMVINATEGGARIAGSLQIPFAQVCAEIASTSLRKPVHEPTPPDTLDVDHMRRLLGRVDILIDSIEAYRTLAAQAEALTLPSKARRGAAQQMTAIDRINDQIKRFDPHAKMLIDAFGATVLENVRLQTHIQTQSASALAPAGKLEAALGRYREVYQGIQVSAEASAGLLRRIRGLYQRILNEGCLTLDQLNDTLK